MYYSSYIFVRNSVCSADEMTVFKLSHSFIHFAKQKEKGSSGKRTALLPAALTNPV